jgi:phage-related protein
VAAEIEFDWVRRNDGSSEFEDFLAGLPAKDAAKLLAVIQNTEAYGLATALTMQWVKKLEDNLWELRSARAGNAQRAVFFHAVGPDYVITHGFTKKTQRTPRAELEHARSLRARYLVDRKDDDEQDH